MTPEGQARAGDLMRDPSGRVVEVVAVTCANAHIEAVSARDRALDAPNYHSAVSITATCAMAGDLARRERRTRQRWLSKTRLALGGRAR